MSKDNTTATTTASPASRKRQADDAGVEQLQQQPAPSRNGKARQTEEDKDEGMGEFEDEFEDEIEVDGADGGEVIYAADSDDEEDDEEDGDTVMIDGVPVHGKIQQLDEDDEDDDTQPQTQETQVYIPGTHKLEEGQTLEPDQSAYEMLHRLNVTWPCLSFDVLADHLGSERRKFPHTSYFVAGTQADQASKNEIMVMKASQMYRTQKDGADSDDEDDDANSDDLDDDAILEYRSIPHNGGINRVRAALSSTPTSSSLEPCLDPYPVAVWSEFGKVGIYDIRPFFNALDRPAGAQALFGADKKKAERPMFTVEAHRNVEGYAMDWAGIVGGGASSDTGAGAGSKTGSLRLLTGDLHSKIFLTTATQSGFTTSPTPFASHTSSIEDLQWSPAEPTVFASCSADRSIRIWDVRVKSRQSVLAVEAAHEQDVNVISWNHLTDYLLVSGGDEGGLNVWDLRSLASSKPSTGKKSNATAAKAPTPVAAFRWHTAPISSVEWHPTEDSVFAASGRDDQVTLWDLSVELDDEEDGAGKVTGPEGREVPDQLLFCHHGASEIKEVHWHKQIPGMLMSTSADGFHLFKTISV
ncbi:hypothetical protein A4X09_0g850 [Tilletia walkeri]|uniref:Histone-binding protein RBBP4-like N-terminal domain-containing protein n=1 Tax=Tilletia walkeri TaxID=117179 RepID=A0A8X7T8L9_9BASI|nr:hypothetical protein A4X09_0g850 [Tilletia walkeri]